MADLRERLGALDRVRAPDLWTDIGDREPGRPPVRDRSGLRRAMVATVALAVAAAAIGFTAHAFLGGSPTTVIVQPGPMANGRIAFIAGRSVYRAPGGGAVGIYAMDPDGSGVTSIRSDLQGVGGLSWSHDGKRLAFSQSGGEFSASNIFVMDADGSGLVQITHGEGAGGGFGDQNITPAWSPDGTLIAFAAAHDSGGGIHGYSIEVMRSDGTDARRLTLCEGSCTGGDVAPTWSPDGSRIAFLRGGDIMVMNADGSDVHMVLACRQPACFGDESPSWSPRGDEIAFVWGHDPHYRIDAVAPDGSGHRTIYDCVSPCLGVVGPSWSPDGTKVVFTYIADDPDVRRDVYVVAADGSALTRLTSGDLEACCPAWQAVPVSH